MLDVEILEIKTTRLTELGINFPNSLSFTPLPESGATGLTVNSLGSLNPDRIGVGLANLLINLRKEVGDFNILANPRIRTKSKDKAQITIGDKVPVITSTTSATGFVAETVTYLDVGLKVNVEPVVSPDDDVTIKLALEVSTLAREVRTSAGSLAYQIGTRNASTSLRLRDGETQVLGGLISNEDRTTSNRIPGLGDLPIAGRLFSSQRDDVQRTELVLAITPHILRTAARPDLAQAEMWVGTELATRLKLPPSQRNSAAEINPNSSAAAAPAALAPILPRAAAPAVLEPLVKPMANPTGPSRAVWQAPPEVKVGEEFTILLNVVANTAIRGAPLEISFSPQTLEILDITEGGFFKQGDGVTSFSQAVNPTTGRIGVGLLRSDGSGASGSGTLLAIRGKTKTPGPVEMRLTSLQPIGMAGPVVWDELPLLKLLSK
jgi:general secretion pathway protein D